jgi:hypothetical protein
MAWVFGIKFIKCRALTAASSYMATEQGVPHWLAHHPWAICKQALVAFCTQDRPILPLTSGRRARPHDLANHDTGVSAGLEGMHTWHLACSPEA